MKRCSLDYKTAIFWNTNNLSDIHCQAFVYFHLWTYAFFLPAKSEHLHSTKHEMWAHCLLGERTNKYISTKHIGALSQYS